MCLLCSGILSESSLIQLTISLISLWDITKTSSRNSSNLGGIQTISDLLGYQLYLFCIDASFLNAR